jgi:tetratricopeptide (TPR) repeat protein
MYKINKKEIIKKLIYINMIKTCFFLFLFSIINTSISHEKTITMLELPEEVNIKIFHYIDNKSKTNFISTCKYLRENFYNNYIKMFDEKNDIIFYNNFGVSEFFFRTFNIRFFKTIFLYFNIKNEISNSIDCKIFKSLCNLIKKNLYIKNKYYIVDFIDLLNFEILFHKNQKNNINSTNIKLNNLDEKLNLISKKIIENYDKSIYSSDHDFFNTEVICMLNYLIRKNINFSEFITVNNTRFDIFLDKYKKIRSLRESILENKVTVWDDILRLDPGITVRDLRAASESYFDHGFYEKYLECYEKIIYISGNETLIDDLREAGLCALNLGKYENSNIYYDMIFKKYKKKSNINDLRMASIAAFYSGNYILSKKYLKKIIQKNYFIKENNHTIEDYRRLYVVYKKIGNYKKSLYFGKKVLNMELGSENHQDYRCVSYCYAKLKNYHKSIVYYIKLFERDDYKFNIMDLNNLRYLHIKNNNPVQDLIYEEIINKYSQIELSVKVSNEELCSAGEESGSVASVE